MIGFENIKEFQIKAAFIYHFAGYATWPNQPDRLKIGVIGNAPITEMIQKLSQKTWNHQPIQVDILSLNELKIKFENYQMLYITDKYAPECENILNLLDHAPVLTIANFENFTQRGGMIEFYVYQDKVRFRINKTNVDKSLIKLSSQLLKLSDIVQ